MTLLYYVYTLAYPANAPLANTVFYVGKGSGNRIADHEREAKSPCGCAKCKAIRSIWKTGLQVQREIILKTDDEMKALTVEREYIHKYAGQMLLNIHHTKVVTKQAKVRQKSSTPNRTFVHPRRTLLMATGERIDLDEEKRKRQEEWNHTMATHRFSV